MNLEASHRQKRGKNNADFSKGVDDSLPTVDDLDVEQIFVERRFFCPSTPYISFWHVSQTDFKIILDLIPSSAYILNVH